HPRLERVSSFAGPRRPADTCASYVNAATPVRRPRNRPCCPERISGHLFRRLALTRRAFVVSGPVPVTQARQVRVFLCLFLRGKKMTESKGRLAYTIPDACEQIGVGRSMLYELIGAGEIKVFH